MPELSFDGNICGLTMTSTVPPGQASLHPTQALRAWLLSARPSGTKAICRSTPHNYLRLMGGNSPLRISPEGAGSYGKSLPNCTVGIPISKAPFRAKNVLLG
jgi:hypothetical protein